MSETGRKPSNAEIRNAYCLFLGREAESDRVVQELIEAADDSWLGGFINSEEFKEGTAKAIRDRTILKQQTIALRPPTKLIAWIADDVPLNPENRECARRSRSWSDLLLITLGDDVFRAAVLTKWDLGAYIDELLPALRAYDQQPIQNIIGAVDRISQDHLEGWIIDAHELGREMAVELWVGDRFLAASKATVIRRNLQDRFDSQGRHGFVLRFRQLGDQSGQDARLIEPASGFVLAQFQLPASKDPPLDLLASMRAELVEVRHLLYRIESLLPEYRGHFTYGLTSYRVYFDTYYHDRVDAPVMESSADVAIVIVVTNASTLELSLTLASIAKQQVHPQRVIVLHQGIDSQVEEAVVTRASRAMPGGVLVETRCCDPDAWLKALGSVLSDIGETNVLLIPCQGILAPDAVSAFSRALRQGACLVYADEDRIDLSADGRQRDHRDPVLRTAFDIDLFRQVDFIGDVVAFKREAVLNLGLHSDTDPATLFDLLLRIGAREAESIMHLPRILFHRAQRLVPSSQEVRAAAVQQQLQIETPEAEVELHKDKLGAQVGGALRVRYPVPPGTKAAIIIPTRDRLDLLGPCLAAISNATGASRTTLEVIVIDNGSELPSTRVVLSAFEQSGILRLIRFDGSFNWALMNNLAADATDADVLIFLNNDTVAIDRSCWDELVMQALRPGIGAVGARMLYEDGTIQHAGMVTGGHGFADHEGTGDPGGSPGYQGRHSLLRRVSAVTGACLATRADLFREVGGFDETLPVEGNDVDYCLKLRAAGSAILYNPYATLYHFESKSRGYNETEEKRRNAALVAERLRERWSDRFDRDPFYNAHFDRFAPAMTRLTVPPTV